MYPILDLRAHCIGPRRFVADTEEALLRVLESIGIAAVRGKIQPGIWVGSRKIASIGIEILDGITRHGVALNLSGELRPFDLILPCGSAGTHPASVEALGVEPPAPHRIGEAFAVELATILGLEPRAVDRRELDRNTRKRERRRTGAAWMCCRNMGE
jgi:lipoyl(octanoyl) transferase